jgi:hypothetical protein
MNQPEIVQPNDHDAMQPGFEYCQVSWSPLENGTDITYYRLNGHPYHELNVQPPAAICTRLALTGWQQTGSRMYPDLCYQYYTRRLSPIPLIGIYLANYRTILASLRADAGRPRAILTWIVIVLAIAVAMVALLLLPSLI